MTGTSLQSIFIIKSVQKRNTEEDIFLTAYNKLITNRSSCDAAGNEGAVKKQRSKSRDFLLLGNLDSFLCQIAKITILAEFWVQQTQRHKNCVFAVLKMWKIF